LVLLERQRNDERNDIIRSQHYLVAPFRINDNKDDNDNYL